MARAKKLGQIRNAKTGEVLVQMFVPSADNDALSTWLRMLTHQLQKLVPECVGDGFFGGPFGYGVNFENDVFEMHPDWQGDCTCGAKEPIHSPECLAETRAYRRQQERFVYPPKTKEQIDAKISENLAHGMNRFAAMMEAYAHEVNWAVDAKLRKEYEAIHPFPICVCPAANWVAREEHDSTCRVLQNCFRHKPSGLTVQWYKYIGRDNEVSGGGDVTLAAVFNDCLRSINGPTLADAFVEYTKALALNDDDQTNNI